MDVVHEEPEPDAGPRHRLPLLVDDPARQREGLRAPDRFREIGSRRLADGPRRLGGRWVSRVSGGPLAATASSPTPVARMATAITTVAAATSRFRSMVLSTPAASFETRRRDSSGTTHHGPDRRLRQPGRQRRAGRSLQPAAEPLAGRGQPALDRPHRTPEHLGRLLVRPALQVAEHHRRGTARAAVPARRAGAARGRVGRPSRSGPRRPSGRPSSARAGGGGPRPTGRTGRPGGRRRTASSPPTPAGGSSRPAGPGPGTWPGTHPGRRDGRPGPPGRPGGPSARAARRGPRRPPRPAGSRIAPAAPRRSSRSPSPFRGGLADSRRGRLDERRP